MDDDEDEDEDEDDDDIGWAVGETAFFSSNIPSGRDAQGYR